MITRKGVIIQTGADTFTAQAVDTNLTADGKSGWQILSVAAYWANGETAAAADHDMNLVLATISTVTSFESMDEIARINWAMQNTGGVAVAVALNLVKDRVLFNPRITVQPIIYIQAQSTLTGLTNAIAWEINYEIVKLTDLEVLKLLQGGA